jgi:formyl-CoA transferase/CoA:oxalate CoA-transferase
VYGHASGYGPKGPRANHPAFDLAAQAQGGIISVTGDKDGFPMPAGAAIADHVGAMHLAFGVVTALLTRERTGRGQKVDTSLLGSQLAMQAWEIQFYVTHGQLGRAGRGHAYLPTIWRVFATADSHVVVGGMPPNRWPGFCEAVGQPDLQLDINKIDEIYELLDSIFPTKTTDEWIELLAKADCICAPVLNYDDLIHDPQALANNYIMEIDHPTQGKMPTVGLPWAFSDTPAEVSDRAPELGQHNEEILLDMGYSWEEISSLREAGALG